jgi:hypothetical protein
MIIAKIWKSFTSIIANIKSLYTVDVRSPFWQGYTKKYRWYIQVNIMIIAKIWKNLTSIVANIKFLHTVHVGGPFWQGYTEKY